jgi:hypothetical protein
MGMGMILGLVLVQVLVQVQAVKRQLQGLALAQGLVDGLVDGLEMGMVLGIELGKGLRGNSEKLRLRAVNFVAWVPCDYQAMLLDKIAVLKRRKTNRLILSILIGWEFGPLALGNSLGALQRIFWKDRA